LRPHQPFLSGDKSLDLGAISITRVARRAAKNPLGVVRYAGFRAFENRQPRRLRQSFTGNRSDSVNPPETGGTGGKGDE